MIMHSKGIRDACIQYVYMRISENHNSISCEHVALTPRLYPVDVHVHVHVYCIAWDTWAVPILYMYMYITCVYVYYTCVHASGPVTKTESISEL